MSLIVDVMLGASVGFNIVLVAIAMFLYRLRRPTKIQLPKKRHCWLLHGFGSVEVTSTTATHVNFRAEDDREGRDGDSAICTMTLENFMARAHNPREVTAFLIGENRR